MWHRVSFDGADKAEYTKLEPELQVRVTKEERASMPCVGYLS